MILNNLNKISLLFNFLKDETFIRSEKVDSFISWNLHLFSQVNLKTEVGWYFFINFFQFAQGFKSKRHHPNKTH